jgi:hypothetical protein
MAKITIALASLSICVGLAACGNDSTPAPSPAAPPELKPEQVVSFKPYAFACVTEDALAQAAKWAVEGAKTKFQGMFDSLQCIQVPDGEKYKVLQVDGDSFEFTHVGNQGADGMWASPVLVKR